MELKRKKAENYDTLMVSNRPRDAELFGSGNVGVPWSTSGGQDEILCSQLFLGAISLDALHTHWHHKCLPITLFRWLQLGLATL